MRLATFALVLPAVPLALALAPRDLLALPAATQQEEAASDEHTDTAPLTGTFVPADYEQLELWPEEFSGELLLLEVLEHGTYVNAGDVVARLDPRKLDEALVDAQRGLSAAERRLHATATRAELAAEAAAAEREAASRELERTRAEHAAFHEQEVGFERRQAELSAASTEDRIEDMRLELETLEAMYADDELIDATEEIVIQRSRRDLARARASQALQAERRALQLELELGHRIQRRDEALAKAEREHAHLVRRQELDAAEREAGVEEAARAVDEARGKLERLQHDRALFELRAPRAGVLLHGGADAQAGGRPEHARAGRLTARTPAFTVADPERLAVALELDADARHRAGDRAAVTVVVPGTDRSAVGRLAAERYPTAASLGRGAAAFDARVELDGTLRGVVFGLPAEVRLGGAHADAQPDAHAHDDGRREHAEHDAHAGAHEGTR